MAFEFDRFRSLIDMNMYRVAWDPDAPILRVFPEPNDGTIDLAGTVCAFEEGRRAHPKAQNPYNIKIVLADKAAAWAQGAQR